MLFRSENNVIVDNNTLSKSMKLSAAKHLAKRYTPRSLRSGCVCQFIINGIRSKGSVDTSDYIAIKTHVGWRDEKSILCYIRTAQTKYQHIQSLLDPDAFSNPIGDVIELIAITTGDTTNRQPSHCESSDQVVLPKRRRQAKRQVLETISTVRWRKLPKEMKALVLNHNSSLKERVANDKSKKNYVWTTYWQALLIEHSKNLTTKLNQLAQYTDAKRKLERHKGDRTKRDQYRNAVLAIEKAMALNDLVEKFEQEDNGTLLGLIQTKRMTKEKELQQTTTGESKRTAKVMEEECVADFEDVDSYFNDFEPSTF